MEEHRYAAPSAARALGCAATTVRQEMHRRGMLWIPDSRRAFIRYSAKEILDLLRVNHWNSGPVAEILGVARSTLVEWCRGKKGLRLKPGRRTWTPTEGTLREMYLEKGMTLTAIGAHFEVSRTSVWLALRRYLIPRRPALLTPFTTRTARAANFARRSKSSLRQELGRVKEKPCLPPPYG